MILVFSRFGFEGWIQLLIFAYVLLFLQSLVGALYANRRTLIRLADAHAYPRLCWALTSFVYFVTQDNKLNKPSNAHNNLNLICTKVFFFSYSGSILLPFSEKLVAMERKA